MSRLFPADYWAGPQRTSTPRISIAALPKNLGGQGQTFSIAPIKSRNREHDCRGESMLGACMTIGEYVAAAVLIVLIVWGVKGVLMQDKFRL